MRASLGQVFPTTFRPGAPARHHRQRRRPSRSARVWLRSTTTTTTTVSSSSGQAQEVNYENLLLPPVRQVGGDAASAVCADEESEWLAKVVQEWLETEYVEEPSTARIAAFTADTFRTIRLSGTTDVGDLVLALAQGCTACDFNDSFSGPFEVANVSLDLIMQRYGYETVSWSYTVPSMQEQDSTLSP